MDILPFFKKSNFFIKYAMFVYYNYMLGGMSSVMDIYLFP